MYKTGNLTFSKEPQAEKYCQVVLERICQIIQFNVNANKLEALILIGGYGRGEGGVVKINNQYFPHNNLDLIAVIKASANECQEIECELNDELNTVRNNFQLGVDISVIDYHRFVKSECRVIWYDMKGGHKVLLGNQSLVINLHQHSKENIPDWDVRNLLINRGSLLLINRLILSYPETAQRRKTVIKHFIKAIIGYGDAILYFKGKYHWSYAQKQLLMRESDDIHAEIKELYEFATNFRFYPDYELFGKENLLEINENLIKKLQNIHLSCEKLRLGSEELNWDSYLVQASSKSFQQGVIKIRPFLRTVMKKIKQNSPVIFHENKWSLFNCLSTSDKLPILFPYILYQFETNALQGFQFKNFQKYQLDQTYLCAWQQFMDKNLAYHLQQLGISLEVPA